MTDNTHDHQTTVSLVQAPPAQIAAGVDMVLKIRIVCSAGCDLRSNTGSIVTEDNEVIKEFYITQFYGINESDALVIKAPVSPGEYTWTVFYPEQAKAGVTHPEASTTCSFTVQELHKTSIAVWDIDSPVITSAPLKLKVGVRCSADCQLTGKTVGFYDEQGTIVASAELGEDRWQGTEALYWAEADITAPEAAGIYSWTARFTELETNQLHIESSASFGFQVVEPPDHTLIVQVIDQQSGLPISGADVVLHPYRGRTAEDGTASFGLPKGDYRVYVTKVEYAVFETTVKVSEDLTITAELIPAPILPSDD